MNEPLKLVIAGVVGSLVFLSGAALSVVAAYWVDPVHDVEAQVSRQGTMLEGYWQQQLSYHALESKQIDRISHRLDALEKSQVKVDDTLQDRIESEVEKAVTEAGVDKAALTDRVRAIIREIAKQSAQEQGRAENRAPNAPPDRRDAAGIGQPVSGVTSVSAKTDHILGDADAPVSLIVYEDFECPFCRRHHPTLKTIARRFEGQVNIVYRHLPLGMHNPAAKREALLSECVARQGGNEAFWGYADAVYKHGQGNGRGLTETRMNGLLESLDLEPQSVRDCVTDNRDQLLAGINDDVTEAQRLGIRGTPGNVLIDNATGEALRINGARPLRQFTTAIDAFLGDNG